MQHGEATWPCSVDIRHGMKHGHETRTWSMEMKHGHEAWTWSMATKYGHTARTCGIDMDKHHGHQFRMDMQHKKQQRHAGGTYIWRKTCMNYMCQSNLWRIWIILAFSIFRILNTPPLNTSERFPLLGERGPDFADNVHSTGATAS